MEKDLLRITIPDIDGDSVSSTTDVNNEDEAKALVVGLISVLHNNPQLKLLVLSGLLTRMDNDKPFSDSEVVMKNFNPYNK